MAHSFLMKLNQTKHLLKPDGGYYEDDSSDSEFNFGLTHPQPGDLDFVESETEDIEDDLQSFMNGSNLTLPLEQQQLYNSEAVPSIHPGSRMSREVVGELDFTRRPGKNRVINHQDECDSLDGDEGIEYPSSDDEDRLYPSLFSGMSNEDPLENPKGESSQNVQHYSEDQGFYSEDDDYQKSYKIIYPKSAVHLPIHVAIAKHSYVVYESDSEPDQELIKPSLELSMPAY